MISRLAAVGAVSLACSLLSTLGAVAQSAPGVTGCWARTYDAAHMAAHSRQQVRAISATVVKAPPGSTYPFNMDLTLRLKGKSSSYWATGLCTANGAGLHCAIEEDGGEVDVVLAGDRLRIENSRSFGVARSGLSPEDGRIEISGTNSEHRTFVLAAAKGAACK